MSTRGAIARLTNAETNSFAGRYHHWDSYPTGLGRTLFQLYRGHFDRDLDRMLAYLLDEHTCWSTINNADFSLPAGYIEFPNRPCTCGEPYWKHVASCYGQDGHPPLPPDFDGDRNQVLGHSFEDDFRAPKGPQCYCHGDRHEEGWEATEKNASESGVEYAYAFDAANRQMRVLSSYRPEYGKMVGMFGQGDPNALWATIAVIDLDGDEPDWENIEAGDA